MIDFLGLSNQEKVKAILALMNDNHIVKSPKKVKGK